MEKASEVVYREFVEIKNSLINKSNKDILIFLKSKWINTSKSVNILIKLINKE